MLKKLILLLLLSVVLVVTSSCGNANEQQVSNNTETPVTTPTETPETPNPTEAVPTAEPAFNQDFIIPDSSIRPVAVMIDNQGDRVLPQGGISQAQIVYEMLVEYNITRYMAFFWGTLPEMVGPVRSSRHYFLDYALEYDAIYTHVGGSEYAKKDIAKLKINTINGLAHGNAFWDLTKDIKNWQDTYTSRERIEKQIAASKYRTEPQKPFPFQYREELVIPASGDKAENISIKFASSNSSTCGYLYDSETKVYDRIRMGKPQIERNTEQQVKVANIIIQETESPRIPNDPEGRRNLKNIGSGDGFYITGGKSVPVKWSKKSRDAQTVYTTADGKPLILNKGQTWIEIVPTLEYVTIN